MVNEVTYHHYWAKKEYRGISVIRGQINIVMKKGYYSEVLMKLGG